MCGVRRLGRLHTQKPGLAIDPASEEDIGFSPGRGAGENENQKEQTRLWQFHFPAPRTSIVLQQRAGCMERLYRGRIPWPAIFAVFSSEFVGIGSEVSVIFGRFGEASLPQPSDV
jgi:hypothetical protein